MSVNKEFLKQEANGQHCSPPKQIQTINTFAQRRKKDISLRTERCFFFKVESAEPKGTLCKIWLKLAQWFRRRRFLKFVNYIFPISLSAPI